jgi:hypothetical protein
MKRYFSQRYWPMWLGVLAMLPLACGGVSALSPTDTPAPTDTRLPPSLTPTVAATDTPEPTATPEPTDTSVPPSRTPRPTATPTPGPGEVVLAPDFSNLDDWLSFGFSFSTGEDTNNYTFDARRSALYIEVPEKETSIYGIYQVETGQPDVQVDVDVETVAGPNRNNISLICRANDEGWYEFSIHSGGLWVIYRFEYAEGFIQLAEGGSTAINMQLAQNHLSITCQGDSLSFTVNDDHLTTVTDNHFPDGFVGVSVTTFDLTGAGIEFSNFEVRVAE